MVRSRGVSGRYGAGEAGEAEGVAREGREEKPRRSGARCQGWYGKRRASRVHSQVGLVALDPLGM